MRPVAATRRAATACSHPPTVACPPSHHTTPYHPACLHRHAVMLSACRGKLMDLRPPRALGPLSDATVPQSWFTHFYALGAAWNTAVSLAFFASQAYAALPAADMAMCVAALTLLQLHLARRLLETVWLMRYPAGARMHLVAYVFGLRWVRDTQCTPRCLASSVGLAQGCSATQRLLLSTPRGWEGVLGAHPPPCPTPLSSAATTCWCP